MSRPELAARPTSLKLELRWLPVGDVVCREGDAPGPMFVVTSGLVRVYRDTADGVVELARLGPGSVIGELAPILNQPRSATVEAVEPTQILEVPLHELGMLARRQTALSRVLAHALHERAGLSAEQLDAIGARLGLNLPSEALVAAAPLAERIVVPPPEHDKTNVYPKEVSCPACNAQFSALIFRPHKDSPSERSSDFHQVYRAPSGNPYDYEIWVCPKDLYAALPADFAELAPLHQPAVADAVANVVNTLWAGERPEFNVDRTLDLREKALQLALAQYRVRQATPLREAAMLHRLAWCARERSDAASEREYLLQALACYKRGYQDMELGGAKEELRVQFLCAELSLRTGDRDEALAWSSQALRHTEIKHYAKWEQMLKELWARAREESTTEATA
jgi:CRP-like cAMP-binding protein/uncharacterized protein (DUF2225 family)